MKTVVRHTQVPSLLIWAQRNSKRYRPFSGLKLSAHSMLIGMELVLEQVRKAVTMIREALRKKFTWPNARKNKDHEGIEAAHDEDSQIDAANVWQVFQR